MSGIPEYDVPLASGEMAPAKGRINRNAMRRLHHCGQLPSERFGESATKSGDLITNREPSSMPVPADPETGQWFLRTLITCVRPCGFQYHD